LVDVIWETANELGFGQKFIATDEGVGSDDHEPFLRAGIDSVDLIQIRTYPFWHTAADTLDKISPESLKTVGDVVLASLPRIEQRLSGKSSN
jgi:Zn-dependent M28 family amino/carboxypeptidase